MAMRLLRGALGLLKWGLCAVGAVALIFTALIATPLQRPAGDALGLGVRQGHRLVHPAAAGAFSGPRRHLARLPALRSRRATATDRGAIFIHGSSGSSGTVNHALTAAIAAHGVETWALDTRGHGASGTRGDIGYVGQLEDDLVDFVAHVRKSAPDLPLTLVGHSAGGGFSLRVAATPIVQDLFVAHRAGRALSRL